MQLAPAIEDFTAGFAAGRNQVVWTRLVADLDTPVSLMLKLTEARKDSFLLESVTGGEVLDPRATPLLYRDTGNIDGSAALFPPSFPVA